MTPTSKSMIPYLNRLVVALPTRFRWRKDGVLFRDTQNMPPNTHWTDTCGYIRELWVDGIDEVGEEGWWAFWGPKLEEFDVQPSDIAPYTKGYFLPNIAEAVCQAAEAKAGSEQ